MDVKFKLLCGLFHIPYFDIYWRFIFIAIVKV